MNTRSFDASVIIPNIAVLCLVAIGLLTAVPPLDSRRPKDTARSPVHTQPDQTLARLWEDPFDVAEPVPVTATTLAAPLKKLIDTWEEGVFWSPDVLGKSTGARPLLPRVLILPVLLRGGDYPDDREFRLRTRYAVLSALGRAQFVPLNYERLGFVRATGLPDRKNFVVPYDFFAPRNLMAKDVLRKEDYGPYLLPPKDWEPDADTLVFEKAYHGVCVLWLDEDRLREVNHPILDQIESLAACLVKLRPPSPVPAQPGWRASFAWEAHSEGAAGLRGAVDWRFWATPAPKVTEVIPDALYAAQFEFNLKVLGPTSSTTLTGMLRRKVVKMPNTEGTEGKKEAEVAAMKQQAPVKYAGYQEFPRPIGPDGKRRLPELISSRATIAPEALQIVTWRKPGELNEEAAFPGWKWRRTVASDDMVVETMLDELSRRRAFPYQKPLSRADKSPKQNEPASEARGPAPKQRKEEASENPEPLKNHLVVVSEWDGVYSRALVRTIAAKISGPPPEGVPLGNWVEMPPNLHEFSYLRGLDGLTMEAAKKNEEKAKGGAPSSSTATSAVATDPATKRDTRSTERDKTYGLSQGDYLRRLADDLVRLDHELGHQGGRIAAIGVLGSDVYDRLLVLRALRPNFGNAIFFTTDLDAALFDESEREWTRNLVVASSFGLTAHRALQDRIPPFRDSYQTSLFVGTLSALNLTKIGKLDFALDGTTFQPRLHEMGRVSPHSLPQEKSWSCRAPLHPEHVRATGGNWSIWRLLCLLACAVVALVFWQIGLTGYIRVPDSATALREDGGKPADTPLRFAVVPEAEEQFPDTRPKWMTFMPWGGWQGLFSVTWMMATVGLLGGVRLLFDPPMGAWSEPVPIFSKIFLIPGILVLMAAYFWTFANVNRWLGDVRNASLPSPSRMRVALGMAWSFLIMGLGLLVLLFHAVRSGSDEEPFGWFDGISIWPTDLMRLTTLLLASVFLVIAQGSLRDVHRRISKTTKLVDGVKRLPGPTSCEPGAPRKNYCRVMFKRLFMPLPTTADDEVALWENYLEASNPQRRFPRVLFMVGLYIGFWITFCFVYGMPIVPARGAYSFALDTGVLSTAILAYMFLLFYVFDATLLASVLVRGLRRTIGVKSALPENRVIHLVNELCEPVSRLIYLPFTILFLMIVSRNTLFDNWDWPLVLIGIFASGLLVIVIAAAVLQRNARQARAEALDHLDNELLLAQASAEKATDSERGAATSRINKFAEERKQVAAFDGVVFGTWLSNPIYRALLIPIGGLGSIQILERVFSAF